MQWSSANSQCIFIGAARFPATLLQAYRQLILPFYISKWRNHLLYISLILRIIPILFCLRRPRRQSYPNLDIRVGCHPSQSGLSPRARVRERREFLFPFVSIPSTMRNMGPLTGGAHVWFQNSPGISRNNRCFLCLALPSSI